MATKKPAKLASHQKGAQLRPKCPVCKGEGTWTRYSRGGWGRMAIDCPSCGIISKYGTQLAPPVA